MTITTIQPRQFDRLLEAAIEDACVAYVDDPYFNAWQFAEEKRNQAAAYMEYCLWIGSDPTIVEFDELIRMGLL